ncbi:ATP-binding protein [Cetobacterium sp.]|uniref:ATP-binding protein n=1 Tax=Cetobacterium sp. TaxID=2071632 RepID=UPI003F3B4924
MKLKIENIGPIEYCDMDINDISVIVGKNASGKSSIGKALFSVLHSISDSQKEVFKQELDSFLERTLNEILRLIGNELDEKIIYYIEILTRGSNEKRWDDVLITLKEFKENKKATKDEKLKEAFGKISLMENFIEANYSSKESKRRILNQILEIEFGNIVKFEKKSAKILLDTLNISTESNNGKLKFDYDEEKKYLYNDAILIESPIILNIFDDLRVNFTGYGHNSYLMKVLTEVDENSGLFKDIEDRKLKSIEEQIRDIISGNLYYDSNLRKIRFEDDSRRELKLSDLAAGVKSLGLLLMVLRKIKANTVLILDEPEVYLHPEWQFVLASIISLISKELGIKILITTHSSIFLEALELNGKKYKLNNNYYYCDNGEVSKVESKNMNEVYKKVNGNIYDMLDKLNLELEGDE